MTKKRRFDPERAEVVFTEGAVQTTHVAIEVTEDEVEWANFEDGCLKLLDRISPPGSVQRVASEDLHAAYTLLRDFSRREEGALLPAPLLEAFRCICHVNEGFPVNRASQRYFLAAAIAEAALPPIAASNPLSKHSDNGVAAAVWPEQAQPDGANHPKRMTVKKWRAKPEYVALVAYQRELAEDAASFRKRWFEERARERRQMKEAAERKREAEA